MVFGLVLAGGIGSRMGNVDKPKQYLMVAGKPVIIHTLEKFCAYDGLDGVIVLCPDDWREYTQDLVSKYLGEYVDSINIITGGGTRNDTIMNGIAYIDEHFDVDNDTIIVTHDAARPFINDRIIRDNIAAAVKFGAVTTAVASTDTILYCTNQNFIDDIPDRSYMYQCQTPQTFHAATLRDMYLALSDDEREVLTDASKILILNGHKVAVVEGGRFNIKITYPEDMMIAEAIIASQSK